MRRYGLLIVLCGGLLAAAMVSGPISSLPASSPPPPPTPTSVSISTPNLTLPNYGTTTNMHGEIQNGAARQQFLEAYHRGEPGRWEQIVYTVEGDPLIYRLEAVMHVGT